MDGERDMRVGLTFLIKTSCLGKILAEVHAIETVQSSEIKEPVSWI